MDRKLLRQPARTRVAYFEYALQTQSLGTSGYYCCEAASNYAGRDCKTPRRKAFRIQTPAVQGEAPLPFHGQQRRDILRKQGHGSLG